MLERVSRLEGAYEQTGQRMDDMNRSINGLRDDMNRSINGLRDDVNRSISGLRDDMNQSVSGLRDDMNRANTELRGEVHALRAETNSRFNNVYVLLGGIWATMIAGFIALAIIG